MAAYLLKIATTGESRPLDLPIEDALITSRLVALECGSKTFLHRVADGKKLAASGIGQSGSSSVTSRDVDAMEPAKLSRQIRKNASKAVANLRKVPRRKRTGAR